MDREAALENAVAYAEEVRKHFSPVSIIMYGSFANGTATTESDIDIAIVFDDYSGDWLKDSAFLWGLTINISTRIEPILLDRTKDLSGFVGNIYDTGEILFDVNSC